MAAGFQTVEVSCASAQISTPRSKPADRVRDSVFNVISALEQFHSDHDRESVQKAQKPAVLFLFAVAREPAV
jgi:hypothetical protein